MAPDVDQLLQMSQAQLDALFSSSPPGPIPNGEAQGTAIIAPGTRFSSELAEFVSVFGWKGKTFDAKKSVLTNRILFLGLNAIIARIYQGPSLFDGKPCIVLDYSETSLIAGWLRDEIRQIGQGFYLGKVYGHENPLMHFSLRFGMPDA
jgi:hypothetical protein